MCVLKNDVQRSTRRRAARELLQRSPVIRKRPRTQWHKFLKQYAETEGIFDSTSLPDGLKIASILS